MLEFLSKYQCGFRKGTEYCLLAMFEQWKSAVDKEKSFGASLTAFLTNFCLLNFMPINLALRH